MISAFCGRDFCYFKLFETPFQIYLLYLKKIVRFILRVQNKECAIKHTPQIFYSIVYSVIIRLLLSPRKGIFILILSYSFSSKERRFISLYTQQAICMYFLYHQYEFSHSRGLLLCRGLLRHVLCQSLQPVRDLHLFRSEV